MSFQIQCDSKNGRGIFFFEFSAPILRLKGRPYKKKLGKEKKLAKSEQN